MKPKATERNPAILVKGISIPEDLYDRAIQKAKREKRSFSAVVRMAIERDLEEARIESAKAPVDDLIDTKAVAKLLKLNVVTVQRRQRKPHDPLRKARSFLANKKPMQFYRSKIEELERKSA